MLNVGRLAPRPLLAARISVWNFALGIANGVCFLVLFVQAPTPPRCKPSRAAPRP